MHSTPGLCHMISRSTPTVNCLKSSKLRISPVRSARNGASWAIAPRIKALRLHRFQRTLGDDEATLPVIAAIDADEDVAGAETADRFDRVGRLPRDSKPQHVHRRAEVLDLQPGLAPHCRMPPVASEYEITRHSQWALRRSNVGTDDFAVRGTERCRLGLHHQLEIRVVPRLGCKEVEKVPLRHERDELSPRRQVREIGESGLKAAETTSQTVRLGVRALQERVVEAELVQDFQGRWMHSVAAEVAQEVGVLLEHQHGHADARQQEPRHHPRRPAADDAARNLARVVGHCSDLRRKAP